MANLVKEFLNNQIVVNWIAPIITGLIVVAVPSGIAKFVQIKIDKKKVNDANNRYLDSIRPYIIQKIDISSKLISDIRNVVVDESDLKNKYVYSEIQLRNKLIMDITESKYIDENNKYELIEFTYKNFKEFENTNVNSVIKDNNLVRVFKLKNIHLIFIVSLIILTIVSLVDREGTKSLENPAALFSAIICMFSVLIILSSMIVKFFRSEVSERKEYDYYTEYYKTLNKMIELKEKHNKNKGNDK